MPAWKGGSGEGVTLKSALQVPDERLSRTVSEEYTLYGPHHRFIRSGALFISSVSCAYIYSEGRVWEAERLNNFTKNKEN